MSAFQATVQDYRRALLAIRDSKNTTPAAWELWVNFLCVQYRMTGHTITATQLATAGSLNSSNIANQRYGTFGQRIADQLGYAPPNRQQGDGKPMWWMSLSTGQDISDKDQHFEFTMRSELAEALEVMGWVKAA